jgi:hypothetical protein
MARFLQYEVLMVVQAELRGSEYSGASKVGEWGNTSTEKVMDQVVIVKDVRHYGDSADGKHTSSD